MSCRLLITKSVEEDRDQIVEYLLNDLKNPQAARHFLDEMEHALDRIGDYPEFCSPSQESYLASLGYRSCRFVSYLLLYVYDEPSNTATVGRIFHIRQEAAKLV